MELRINENASQGRILIRSASNLSLATLKTCNMKLTNQEGISMAKPSSTRPQGARRKIAGTSTINVASQVSAFLVTSFVEG